MDKTVLRSQMLQLRSQLKPKFMENSAKRMGGQIAALPFFHEAKTVMLYHSFRNEAGTLPLLQYCLNIDKIVVLPLIAKDPIDGILHLQSYQIPDLESLRPGPMGIMEPDPLLCQPVDPALIDLIVVPGVVFDTSGSRIGYGKGCYDRFLPLLLDDVPVIGLAYDFQVLPRIPQDPCDIPMDLIVTEKGILKIPGSKIKF